MQPSAYTDGGARERAIVGPGVGPAPSIGPARPVKPIAAVVLEAAGGRMRCFQAGEAVLEQGEPCDRVVAFISGVGRCVHLTADGRRCVTRFVWARQAVGLTPSRALGFSLEAVTAARIVSAPVAAVWARADADASVRDAVLATLAADVAAAERAHVRLARLNAEERVAAMALELVAGQGGPKGGQTYLVPMSRLDLADHLGLTLETVSRAMNALHRRGVLALADAHKFTVCDFDALAAAAGSPAP